MTEHSSSVVSLVVQDKRSKLELLAAVSAAAGRPVCEAGTPRAHVPLEGGRAEIEVPKFGEDVQLAIDVTADSPAVAATLLAALRAQGLRVSVLGEAD